MSDASKPTLDLSELRLMPKWVSDFSKTPSRTDADTGAGDDSRSNRPYRDHDPRGGGIRNDRRDGPPRGDRKPFDRSQGGRGDSRPPQRGGPRDDRRGGGRDGARSYGRDDRGGRSYEDAPRPVAGLLVHVEPESKATEAMAAMIRTAGKAYSVFDAARLVLASGDRFHVKFALPAESPQKLYAIPSNSSLWLSEDEAFSQFLNSEALGEFYKVEEVELEAPKGNFTSVAVCGMSGEPLGPTSHHSYQSTLHKIHRERFSHMAFEDYKRRVRTDSSPEGIEKWKDSLKHGTQWIWLKGEVAEGEEPVRLKSRSEMEAHFRKNHAESLIREVTEATVTGNIPKQLLSPSLYLHLRRGVDDARKHLLQIAQQLCGGFEHNGLKLFKRRGGKLWVSRTRPRALDSTVALSERIAKIVEIVKAKPGITTKDLIEIVAPTVAENLTAPFAVVETPAPAAELPIVEESVDLLATPETTGESETAPFKGSETSAPEAAVETSPDVAETPAAPAAEVSTALSDAQVLALKDLHWLNSEGYVIEYADGVVFPGVTEPPPPKPKVVREPAAVVASAEETPAVIEDSSSVAAESEAPAETVADSAPAVEAPVEESAPVAESPAEETSVAEPEIVAAQDEAAAVPETAAVEESAPVTEEASTEAAPEAESESEKKDA